MQLPEHLTEKLFDQYADRNRWKYSGTKFNGNRFFGRKKGFLGFRKKVAEFEIQMKYEPEKKKISLTVQDTRFKTVVAFGGWKVYSILHDQLMTLTVEVIPQYRKLGIGRAMYDYLTVVGGFRIVRSPVLFEDGKNLWARNKK